MIHPTAVVHPDAQLAAGVEVGPYTTIGEQVQIGEGTVIGSHVAIDSFVSIEPDCRIYQFASIGAPPQAVKYAGEETWVKIGRGTTVREFVTINRGTGFGGGITEVGEENMLMAYCHLAHDCKTGFQVIMANAATLGGHIVIGDHVTVGGLVAIHQFVRIGDHAFIGGKAAVPKDIPPYVIASGDRARLHGLNTVGLKRGGFTPETVRLLKKTYRIIFRIGLTLNEAIERVKAEVEQVPEVANIIDFIISSQRGITR